MIPCANRVSICTKRRAAIGCVGGRWQEGGKKSRSSTALVVPTRAVAGGAALPAESVLPLPVTWNLPSIFTRSLTLTPLQSPFSERYKNYLEPGSVQVKVETRL